MIKIIPKYPKYKKEAELLEELVNGPAIEMLYRSMINSLEAGNPIYVKDGKIAIQFMTLGYNVKQIDVNWFIITKNQELINLGKYPLTTSRNYFNEEQTMKTTTQALKEYLSLATTEINKGESSLNQMVEKIYYLMKVNGHKISKKTIRESFQWDKLEWELKEGV